MALIEPSGPVQRYEWPHVGDLLHLDLKRLVRVVGIGHRSHGDRRRRSRHAGYEFLHVAIDDATGSRMPRSCRRTTRQRAPRFSDTDVVSTPRCPDPPAADRQCDGLSIAGVLRVRRAWAVRQRYTRPYRPQTNGKAERFIQTLLREWAYRLPYRSSARRTAALRPYLRFYNHRRPHASLGRRSPWMRFQEAA